MNVFFLLPEKLPGVIRCLCDTQLQSVTESKNVTMVPPVLVTSVGTGLGHRGLPELTVTFLSISLMDSSSSSDLDEPPLLFTAPFRIIYDKTGFRFVTPWPGWPRKCLGRSISYGVK